MQRVAGRAAGGAEIVGVAASLTVSGPASRRASATIRADLAGGSGDGL